MMMAGKAYVVYGAGISGRGAVEVLARRGEQVFLYNDNPCTVDEALVAAMEANGSMIVTNFEQVSAVSAYYLDKCDAYIYNEYVVDPVLTKLFEDNTYELHGEDIATYINDKYSDVYYFGTGHERENYVADWEEKGIKVTFLDECLIERYWINVYKLETE